MEKLNNILVCLDLTEMDDFLIRYVNYMIERIGPKKVFFLHLLRQNDLPKEILADFPDLVNQPLDNVLREELEDKVNKVLLHTGNIDYSVEVREGVKSDLLLQFTREHAINLTIMGKKVGYNGTGALPRRIMPLTPSSVILVSETASPKIQNILVRMDFSKMSEIAMKTAVEIASHTNAKIVALNAYGLSIRHFPNYSPKDELRLKEKMTKHGEKEYDKFMKKMKLDPQQIPCSYAYDKDFNEAQVLYHYGLMHQADLIMIGSKIKSGLANVILDRTSEDLADVEKNIPVMIVKDRKQTLGFLEALFD